MTPPSPSLELDVEAATPQALLEALARRLFESLIDQNEVGTTIREKILVDAPTVEALLREALRTLLALITDQQMALGLVTVTEFEHSSSGAYSLRAEVLGEPIDTHRHHFRRLFQGLSPQHIQLITTPRGLRAKVSLGPESPKQ